MRYNFGSDSKETEFNSSVATLKRIDSLIVQLHDLNRGIIPTNSHGMPVVSVNPQELYIKTINRLYLEGKPKFNPEEIEKLSEVKSRIKKIVDKYGINLYMSTVSKGMPPHNHINKLYYTGWNDVVEANEEFEELIMLFLDKHGMLMTNKDRTLAAARV